jgi:hypothetical protein
MTFMISTNILVEFTGFLYCTFSIVRFSKEHVLETGSFHIQVRRCEAPTLSGPFGRTNLNYCNPMKGNTRFLFNGLNVCL